MSTIYDITPLVSPRLAVWPGDNAMEREVLLDMAKGDSLTLSTLRATVHLGAHADAPSHYGKTARTIEAQPLAPYLGPCQVVTADVGRGVRVTPKDLGSKVSEPRVLIRTGTYPNSDEFNEDFAALSPELINAFAAGKGQLIGIDTPSVDLFESKELPSHQAALRHDVALLEGIRLEGVPDGVYELIALPLKLEGFDASPVRAILRTMP